VIEVHHKHHENDQHRNHYNGRSNRRPQGVIPEFHPAKDRHFDQKEEESQYGAECPGELYEPAHAFVRWLWDQFCGLEFGDGFDVGKEVGGDHKGEDVDSNQDGGADGKHYEEPLGDVGWLVDLKFHHGDLK
jgi:hypothetical protein